MQHITLEAWPRTAGGTSAAHKVRAEGFVPAVVLGHHEAPVTLKLKSSDIARVLHQGGGNALVDLNVDGKSTLAMVREFTRNPVSRAIIHVDFQRMVIGEAMETSIPITLIGHSEAENAGALLTQELNTLLVKASAGDLPSHLEVDTSHLEAGHAIHVSDVNLPEGVTATTPGDSVVATLSIPRGAVEAAAEAPAGPTVSAS